MRDRTLRAAHQPSNAIDVVRPRHNVPNNIDHHNPQSVSEGSSTCSIDHNSFHKSRNLFPDTVDFGASASFSPSIPNNYNSPIDNTTLEYVPVTLPCGVQTMCAPEVLSSCPMVLRSLQTDLVNIFKLLPWSVHSFIRRTKIWVNATYSYGTLDNPKVLTHSTAHHHEAWLLEVAHDRPEKACSIEIYNCFDFERMRLHWNGCGLLLHEFCHLIHQFCFGLDNPRIVSLYEAAIESGLYERTLRRDWAGSDEEFDQAYATVDHKEFFAEMMITYLSNAYHELDGADSAIMEECCPVLLQPDVTERVLKSYGIEDEPLEDDNNACAFILNRHMRGAKPKIRLVNPVLQESALARSCLDVKHCNKFYPFTRGQLKHHDPDLYCAMRQLFKEIVMWDDPEDTRQSCRSLKKILPLF